MSFVWKAATPLQSEEQIARTVHQVSLARNLDELASVLALMCIRQESNFWCPWNAKDPSSKNYPYDSQSDDGRSVGYYQQQNGRAGDTLPAGDRDNWWGSMASRMDLRSSTNVFLERLADDYTTAANGAVAGQFIQRVQRSAYPDAYAKHWDYCWSLLRRALGSGNPTVPQPTEPGITPNPNWRGDPTFLPEVLRAEGLTVREIDGWRDRGHGDFGAIWGVVAHHTGSNGATAESIAFHPTLGLASQIHLAQDGVVTLCGVGIAWHAGQGSYPGLPTNNANSLTIGIEAANDGGGSPGKPHRSSWPDAQYNAYVKTVAAILRFLGHDSSHVISHKEWAGAAQGKWDPGAIDMNVFRADVQRQIESKSEGDDPMSDPDVVRKINEIHACLFNQIPSQSKYKTAGEVAKWQLHELLKNDDAMIHEMLVERQAMMGNPEAVALVKREADKGDKWSQQVYAYLTEAE